VIRRGPDGDGAANEIPVSLVDYFEFYLLNYFKPAHEQTKGTNVAAEFSIKSAARFVTCPIT
jgi:hypothetical protein